MRELNQDGRIRRREIIWRLESRGCPSVFNIAEAYITGMLTAHTISSVDVCAIWVTSDVYSTYCRVAIALQQCDWQCGQIYNKYIQEA